MGLGGFSRALEEVFRALEKVFRALEEVFRTLEKVFRALKKVFRALEKVFRALKKVFRALEKVFRALEKVFRALKKVFRALAKNRFTKTAGRLTLNRRISAAISCSKEVFMGNDTFSLTEDEYPPFASNFCAAAAANAALLGIPAAFVTDTSAKLAAYLAAHQAADAPNAGKIDREDRREKREALTHNMRKIKIAYLDADPLGVVTPEVMLSFGLEVKDTIRSDIPDPTDIVTFSLENGGYLKIIVRHPARPAGYNGAVAFIKVGGEPPKSHKEMTDTRLLTRPIETLYFEAAQLGQTVYIALAWQNEKGRLGPPSPIQSHVIA
jgi:hypothetical protein